MKNLDVLLINVPTNRGYKKDLVDIVSMPPLGLMYIASYLRKFSYSVKIIDMSVTFYSKKKFVSLLINENPKLIGMSTFTESWSAMKLLTKLSKEVLPDTYIVGGGPSATFSYSKLLKETDFDYMVLGEGEYTFTDLCKILIDSEGSIEEVKGVAYLKNGKLCKTRESTRIKNLDSLEWPSRDLIDLDKYIYPITLSTARGCPGECMFCSSKSFWGEKIYFRSPENILEEILAVERDFNISMFFIIDDTFTMVPKRVMKFCDLLKNTGKKFIWGCESRADVATKDILAELFSAGCRKIQFGMESGNNTILKKIGKKVTVEQIENAVKIAAELGFDINVSFIIGHVYDTHDTVQQSLKMAIRLKDKYNANLFCSVNTPYPGTDIYEKYEEYGLEILTSNRDKYTMDNAIINTKNLKAVDLREYYQLFTDVLLDKRKVICFDK